MNDPKPVELKEVKWPDKICSIDYLTEYDATKPEHNRANGWNACLEACKKAWQEAKGKG